MAKSDYLEAQVLDAALGTDTFPSIPQAYMALYSTNPTDADTGTELSGNGYARQTIDFSAAAVGAGSTSNSSQVTFTATGGNWVNATHFGIRDAATLGNLLYHAPLDNARQLNDGETLIFDPGSVTGSES